MKRLIIFLFIVLMLTLLTVSSSPVLAMSVTSLDESVSVLFRSKISDDLIRRMDAAGENEKISVVVWYEDIDQEYISTITTRITKVNVDELLHSDDFELQKYTQNREIPFDESINNYLRDSTVDRIEVSNKVNAYISTRRRIATESYVSKAKQIIFDESISEDIDFCSRYAPMMICSLTKDKIVELAKNNKVLSVQIEDDAPVCEPSVSDVKSSIGQTKLNNTINLTGENVKVGIVEGGYPVSHAELDMDSIIKIGNPDNNEHAKNTARVLVGANNGLAKDIILYSTNADLSNIEAMLDEGVQIINVSFGWIYFEDATPSDYAYSRYDKWFDHISSYHNVTVIASVGNAGDGTKTAKNPSTGNYEPYYRVLSPAMGDNVIAVGAYSTMYTDNLLDDQYVEYSSYKNNKGSPDSSGNEKPDVLLPKDMLGEGTSTSAPILTAMVAQILQLKPALAAYPQLVKSIVLASCHRKSLQNNGTQEYITDGITEKQGAGIPDVWIMASIVSNGSYGMGTISRTATLKVIDFVQPAYDNTNNITISVSWLRDNNPQNSSHISYSSITMGEKVNLSLSIKQNNNVIGSSALDYSSTEMCNISTTNTPNYRIELTKPVSSIDVRYAYAWSINDTRYSLHQDEDAVGGIYFIGAGDQYITYNTNANNDYERLCLLSAADQQDLDVKFNWILDCTDSGFLLYSSYGYSREYLSVGTYVGNSLYYSKLSSTPMYLDVIWNSDGSSSIVDINNSKILYLHQGVIYWKEYNGVTIDEESKLQFSRQNYYKGDVDMNGVISDADATIVQLYLVGLITYLDNTQMYLADTDRSNTITILDATRIHNQVDQVFVY